MILKIIRPSAVSALDHFRVAKPEGLFFSHHGDLIFQIGNRDFIRRSALPTSVLNRTEGGSLWLMYSVEDFPCGWGGGTSLERGP